MEWRSRKRTKTDEKERKGMKRNEKEWKGKENGNTKGNRNGIKSFTFHESKIAQRGRSKTKCT